MKDFSINIQRIFSNKELFSMLKDTYIIISSKRKDNNKIMIISFFNNFYDLKTKK